MGQGKTRLANQVGGRHFHIVESELRQAGRRNPIKSRMGSTPRPGVSLGTRQATERCSSFPNTRNTSGELRTGNPFLVAVQNKRVTFELRVNSVAKD